MNSINGHGRQTGRSRMFLERVFLFARMIKFGHTVFALPFALSAVILAQRQNPLSLTDVFWILVAMIGARSVAMGFNRVVDARIDSKNPRTSNREIPSGRLSSGAAKKFVILSASIFILAAAMLGRLCLYLSFPVLAILCFYSYTKRFTVLSHVFLGFSIALAPLGAWIAIAKVFSKSILLLSLALLTYVTGFDILYACQDMNFDKKEGLYSFPAKYGIKRSLFISAGFHYIAFCCLLSIYFVFNMNMAYLITVFMIGLLLIIEHRLVKPDDLSNLKVAFFHVNGIISATLFLGILADELVRRLL